MNQRTKNEGPRTHIDLLNEKKHFCINLYSHLYFYFCYVLAGNKVGKYLFLIQCTHYFYFNKLSNEPSLMALALVAQW